MHACRSTLEDPTYAPEADSIFSASSLLDARDRLTLLWLRSEQETPEALAAEVRRLVAETLDESTVSWARAILEQLGREEEVRGILAEAAEQNRANEPLQRLGRQITSNPRAAQALSDSLENAGVPPDDFEWSRFVLREHSGDTLAAKSIIEWSSFPATRALGLAANAAYDRGYSTRADRLFAMALARSEGDYGFLLTLGDNAVSRNQLKLLDDVERKLAIVCPDCPTNEASSITWRLDVGDREGARAQLRRVQNRRDLPTSILIRLAYSAQYMGEPSLADSLLDRAEAASPDRRDVKAARATLLLQAGDHAGAAAIVQPLLQTFPGREDYRRLMSSAGGAAGQAKTPPTDSAPFDLLEHNLTSTEWIREGLSRADTLSSTIGIQLLSCTSYICSSTEASQVRNRMVLKLTTALGVETYQTVRITFLSHRPPPIVRSARIVFPDGGVVDVPRSEIAVASAGEAGSSIADVRQLVIPFAGLKVGAAVDLVWEEEYPKWGMGGWSFRGILSGTVPIRESVMEVVHPRGMPLRVRQGPLAPAPESTAVGSYSLLKWTMRDLRAAAAVPLGGSPYDLHPWVACTAYRSWDEAAQAYAGSFWEKVAGSDEIRRIGADIARQARTQEQKLERVLDSLAARVEYLAIELGPGRYVPTSAPEVLSRRYGDCKDMVALAIALLEASGLRSEPILVTSRSEASVFSDFPEPELFTHMILWVPGVRRGVFCDITLRPPSIGAIGADYEGTLGLRVARAGTSELVTLPSYGPDAHGYSMEIDVVPSDDGTAEMRVRARFRGELARSARYLFQTADTASASYAVDRVLGYGLPGSCRRTSWNLDQNGPTRVLASATYRDTAWTKGSHTVTFAIQDEVGDPYFTFPSPRDRSVEVKLPYVYCDTVRIRLHPGAGWEPDYRLAAASIRDPRFSGVIETEPPGKGRQFVEVRQWFEMKAKGWPKTEYGEFHRSWLRFAAAVYQPYRYRRVLDQKRLDEIRAYRREHTSDIAYTLQAASEILGDDLGGEGPEGAARRSTCRELLDPLRYDPDAGVWPHVYLSAMAMRDRRFRDADSLAREALGRERGNPLALSLAITTRNVLGDREGELAYLREFARRSPTDAVQMQLLRALYRDGLEDEARQIESRMVSLHGSIDSTAVLGARLVGFIESLRCREARKTLDDLRRFVPQATAKLLDADFLLKCGEPSKALASYEELWLEDPINPVYCNNLAWLCAIVGRDLDLAEEITRITLTLSEVMEEAARNTLGAITARRGNWGQARTIFQEILDRTEELDSKLANAYMVGLCDYQLGRKEEALRRWRETLSAAPPGEWRERIGKTLELSARGGPVTEAMFVAK